MNIAWWHRFSAPTGLVARTDRPAIIGHDQVPCTGITRDDRPPACRSEEIMSRRARRRQDAWRALVNPPHCRSILRIYPASARPLPMRRPRGVWSALRGEADTRWPDRRAAGPAFGSSRVPRAYGFPQAGGLFDPDLRAIRGLAPTAAHTQDRPRLARPGPGLPET